MFSLCAYLCASLFQPSRQTSSRGLVRCSQRAWLGERGAERGRSQRRTTRPAGRPSWELGAPPASHSLAQAYLAGLSGHRAGEHVSIENKGFKKSLSQNTYSRPVVSICWLCGACLGTAGSGCSPTQSVRYERWQTDGHPPPPLHWPACTPGLEPAARRDPSSVHQLAQGFSNSDAHEADLQK